MLKHSRVSKSALNEASLPSLPAAAPVNLEPEEERRWGWGVEGMGVGRPGGAGDGGAGKTGKLGNFENPLPELTLQGTHPWEQLP